MNSHCRYESSCCVSTTEVVCTQGAVISQGLSTIARAVTSDLLISQDLSIPCKARWLQARINLYKRISPEQVWRYDIWTSASRGRAATATSGGAPVGRPRKLVPTSDNRSLVCHCTIQGNTKAPLSMVGCESAPNVPADLLVAAIAVCCTLLSKRGSWHRTCWRDVCAQVYIAERCRLLKYGP